jgi:hypothetical protein
MLTELRLYLKLHFDHSALYLSDDCFAISQRKSNCLSSLYASWPIHHANLLYIGSAARNPGLNPDDEFHGGNLLDGDGQP